jgi:MFS family permease
VLYSPNPPMVERAGRAFEGTDKPSLVRRVASAKALAAFSSPAFTFLWLNTLSFALIQGFQRFAFIWLVLELTQGPRAAGLITFALGIPVFFFSLPAGVWSDRMDRRFLLMSTQAAAVVVMALTAALFWLGVMSVLLAFALAVAVGTTIAVGQPVRTAILPALVEKDRLMNAIVMSTLGQNISLVVGPVIGGAVIAIWGIGGSFVAQALLYALGLLVLLPLKVPPLPERPAAKRGMLGDVKEGLAFVFREREIAILILLLVVSGLFMMGPIFALLPQVAKEVLGREAFAASFLFAPVGVGMMLTSLVLASLGDVRNKGGWFISQMIIAGGVVAGIGLSQSYGVTVALMFIWGMGGGIFVNLNRTLIQANTPDALMGRVMSIYSLGLAGVAPLGGLLAGAMGGAIGAQEWLIVAGCLLGAISAFVFVTEPGLRRMS